MNLLNKLPAVKAKVFASLIALSLSVLVPAMAFADDLTTGAEAQVTKIAGMVGTVGVAVLAIVGAVAAVNVVMRMIKKS